MVKSLILRLLSRELIKKLQQKIENEIASLLWLDIDAIHQLDDYCLNRRNKVDNRVKALLISKQILAEDGTLPDLTNEIMFELRTGQKPFWL